MKALAGSWWEKWQTPVYRDGEGTLQLRLMRIPSRLLVCPPNQGNWEHSSCLHFPYSLPIPFHQGRPWMTKSPVSLTTEYQAGLNALPHLWSTSWHILLHLCADGAPAFLVPNHDGNWLLEHLSYLGPIRIHWFPSWHRPSCVFSTVTVPAWPTVIFPYTSHLPIPGSHPRQWTGT